MGKLNFHTVIESLKLLFLKNYNNNKTYSFSHKNHSSATKFPELRYFEFMKFESFPLHKHVFIRPNFHGLFNCIYIMQSMQLCLNSIKLNNLRGFDGVLNNL